MRVKTLAESLKWITLALPLTSLTVFCTGDECFSLVGDEVLGALFFF